MFLNDKAAKMFMVNVRVQRGKVLQSKGASNHEPPKGFSPYTPAFMIPCRLGRPRVHPSPSVHLSALLQTESVRVSVRCG